MKEREGDMTSQRARGVIVPVLTPFDADGAVHEAQLRAHLQFLLAGGVHAIFPLGTMGEGILLSVEERKRVTDICVEEVNGRVPVLIHAGALTTGDAVELARYAWRAGADAAVVVAPFFYRLDERSIERHFRAVLEASGLPTYLYNIPRCAGNVIAPELVGRLAQEYPHLHGIKDSSVTVTSVQAYLAAVPAGFAVLTGSNELTLPVLAIGGHGVVSSLANVFPSIMVQLCEACWAQNLTLARKLQERVDALCAACRGAPHGMSYKTAIELMGRPFGGVRPPLRESTSEEKNMIRQRLSALGCL
jgi:4-hydroxy-tetrahydrodipicolinate synthase